MKKQELIHLHGLLAEVRTQCEMWEGEFDLTEYESHGIEPTSIHKSKTDHKEAVFALTNCIATEMEDTESKGPEKLVPNK